MRWVYMSGHHVYTAMSNFNPSAYGCARFLLVHVVCDAWLPSCWLMEIVTLKRGARAGGYNTDGRLALFTYVRTAVYIK